jgi:phage repressor protein C with HTH and peptisase S24 domain
MKGLDLKKIREENGGLTQLEMAKRLGVKFRTYQNYEYLDKIPTVIEKLVKYEMFSDKVSEPPQQYQNLEPPNDSSIMKVPLVHQYAYAGYLSGYSDDDYISDLPTVPFVVESKVYRGNYMAFEVRGDSMDNRSIESYPEHSIVMGREISKSHWQSKLHISQWDFIIVHETEGVLLKRIINHDVERGTITLHSLNDLYEDFTVSLNECIKIFNVVKKILDPVR